MKNLLFTLCFLLLASMASGQYYYVSISGTVTETGTGNPLSSEPVTIEVDTFMYMGNVFSYSNMVYSNAAGFYTDTVVVPGYVSNGISHATVTDCNAIDHTLTNNFTASTNNFNNQDFQICQAAQYSVIISGTITETGTGNPLSSYPLTIYVDSTIGGGPIFGYTNTIYTNSSGYYADTINIPAIITGGVVHARVGDCNWVASEITNNFTTTSNNFTNQDFQICYNPPGFILTGTLQYAPGSPAGGAIVDSAEVYLIYYDAVAGTLTAIDTIVTDSGVYFFYPVPPGDYLIKAALLPTSVNYAGYLPTYLGDVLFWSSGTSVTVSGNSYQSPINLQPGVNPGGPGFVGGLVSAGANKTAAPGDPIEGVQIMLLNMNDSPVQYTYTNALGEFSFSNVAYGTYKVYAELVGIPTVPNIVTLSATNPSINNVNIEVNSTDVVNGVREGLATEWTGVNLYPNPSNGNASIAFELTKNEDAMLEVVGVDGRLAFQRTLALQKGANKIALDLDLPTGIYLIKLQTSTQAWTQRMMVD